MAHSTGSPLSWTLRKSLSLLGSLTGLRKVLSPFCDLHGRKLLLNEDQQQGASNINYYFFIYIYFNDAYLNFYF